ncbi:ABC transporter permease [Novosphingobium sp. Gsoil 351]|uniref:ABC transporter permease n=1 Tax=Novosphingobium sp. Gsoil 351 TaxID=2675225 RepID=UPI0012B4B8AC|nr:ABC transporter permease [Novosphingobium sp. Gsoil 351]QGN53216.1 ABC transporter permease subunit [Novosphingobium sp. Gsoil 351]
MNRRFTRLAALALKELKVVLLDRRARTTLVISPIIQLVLFGFATTLEVKAIDIGIVDRDGGRAAQAMVAALDGSPNVRRLRNYPSEAALDEGIARRQVIAGLILPQRLSADIAAGRGGEVLALLDGRRTNAAQIVGGYLGHIAQRAGSDLRPVVRGPPQPQTVTRHFFNPNLDYLWFTMPAMIAVITAVLVLSVSGQSVAREREFGTFDELMILPLRPYQILLGKIAPALLVGVVNCLIYAAAIPLLYGVPLTGSVGLLLLGVLVYTMALVGLGLMISTLASNQQQGFLGMFFVTVPMILLSGYASPVDNMPAWLQPLVAVNPTRHMIVISEGVFLKDLPADLVLKHLLPMLAAAAVTFTTASTLFRARRE